jgi:hypothetical protein
MPHELLRLGNGIPKLLPKMVMLPPAVLRLLERPVIAGTS